MEKKTFPPTTLLLVDDHDEFREYIRELFSREVAIEVVGEAHNGHEAVEQAVKLAPDVVLLDISMPGMNGFEAARQITGLGIAARVLLFSNNAGFQYEVEARKVGASGLLKKNCTASDLFAAVHAVAQGAELEYRASVAV